MTSANLTTPSQSKPEPPAPQPDAAVWMDTEAVATYTGFAENTLVTWRSKGRGPVYFKIGTHVRYRREDVEAWMLEFGQRVQTDHTRAA